MVTRADGTKARVDALREGDGILAATRGGTLTNDTVSLLSIAKPQATAAFVALATSANRTLALTPEHHLPVGQACCSRLQKAKDVRVGDTVWAVDEQRRAIHPAKVTAISKAPGHGLHSPVLTHGGFPVVDGLVTSFDRIEYVALAAYALPAALAACKATGTCGMLRQRP